MTGSILNRRAVLVGSAAALAFGSLQQAIAQTAAAEGDWLDMIKAQHNTIAWMLSRVIADVTGSSGAPQPGALQQLTLLLTAHSVAEENVIYPALATHNLPVAAAELYLEQNAQKVLNSLVDMEAAQGVPASTWVVRLEELRDLILKHAQEREEKEYFPKLHSRLSAAENELLTQNFQKFFGLVRGAS